MRTPLEKNLTPVPRTLSEATRDAQYACAITTFKTDTRLAIDFIEKAILGFMWTAVYAGIIGAVVYWFFWG
jgi:hypothetical protein